MLQLPTARVFVDHQGQRDEYVRPITAILNLPALFPLVSLSEPIAGRLHDGINSDDDRYCRSRIAWATEQRKLLQSRLLRALQDSDGAKLKSLLQVCDF